MYLWTLSFATPSTLVLTVTGATTIRTENPGTPTLYKEAFSFQEMASPRQAVHLFRKNAGTDREIAPLNSHYKENLIP